VPNAEKSSRLAGYSEGWRLSRPCSVVATQGNTKDRPRTWEDEAQEEPHFPRVQQGVPPAGRPLPGMPLEMPDPDGDDSSRPDWSRARGARNPWWRPQSTWGRVGLGMAFLIVMGGLATSAYLLKTYLGRDSRFRIAGASNIEATGLTEVSRAEMLPVFGEDIGRNIFFVPLGERRKQLEEIPWVERATVMRLLPDQIRVLVVERRPVAFVRQGQQIGLVDANGVLLTMPAAMMAQHNYSFPVVTGMDAHDPAASRKARMAVYERLLAELDSSSQHLSEQISEIDLSDPEDARVRMPEQGADILAHFGEDRFLGRYQRYKEHIAEWKQQYPKLVAVDLRYDQQVVLEMAPGTNAVQALVGDQSAPNTDGVNVPAGDGSAELALNGPAKPKPGIAGGEVPGEAAQSKLAANKSDGKASTKPAEDGDSRPKTSGTRDKPFGDKAARDTAARGKSGKERMASERAAGGKHARISPRHGALSVSKKKPASTSRQAAASSKGE